jgi:hypothetical protein
LPVADLKVDYQLLDTTERSLSNLVSEFTNIQAQEQAYDGAMGSGDIAGALGNFASNWDYHRKKLIGSMQALGGMVAETKKQFQQTDQKLKASLTQK